MALLQYLGKQKQTPFKLRDDMLAVFPWDQMVNRVIKHKLDPFIVETPVETIHDIKNNIHNDSFFDLMNKRAIELFSYKKPIYLLWSGGIDSTSALIAFLKTGSTTDIENIFIVCSSESISEYPELWQDINKTFRGRVLPSHVHVSTYCNKGIVVTGEHGDQIFGSDVMLAITKIYGFEAVLQPWEDVMPKFYEKQFGPNYLVTKYRETIDASLYPIKTAFDWVWWFNFTNKWNHVKYRMLGIDGWDNPKEQFQNVHHFFDTIPFQQWSMTHPNDKIKDAMNSYKFLAKEYIVDYTKHESYLTKEKKGSLQNLWRVKKARLGISTDFNYLTAQQIEEYINK